MTLPASLLCVYVCVCVHWRAGQSCSTDHDDKAAQSERGDGLILLLLPMECTVQGLTSPVREGAGRVKSHAQAPRALPSAPTTIHMGVRPLFLLPTQSVHSSMKLAWPSSCISSHKSKALTHKRFQATSPPCLPDPMCHTASDPHQYHSRTREPVAEKNNKSSDNRQPEPSGYNSQQLHIS